MNYCQFRNDVIKRNAVIGDLLPSAYRQVEYIQSNGTQFIDTGINTSTTLKTSVDFSVIPGFLYYNTACLFGSYISSSSSVPVTAYSVGLASNSSIRVPNYNLFSNCTIPTISANAKYNLSYQFGSIKFEGASVGTYSGTAQAIKNVYLFGRNFDSSPDMTAGLRIYYVVMESGNTKYRELIPCVRKADGKPGMYDVVTETFFTSATSSDFSLGSSTDVPAEYQKVEYIQSNGTQYIDLGYSMSDKNKTDIFIDCTVPSSNSQAIVGAFGTAGNCGTLYTNGGNLNFYYRSGNPCFSTGQPLSGGHRCQFTVNLNDNSVQYYNIDKATNQEYTKTATTSGSCASGNLYLFAQHNLNNNNISGYASIKMYRFTVSFDNKVARDMYPCYRKSDSKPGMYDLITNTFFTNSGSGADFTVGNNI